MRTTPVARRPARLTGTVGSLAGLLAVGVALGSSLVAAGVGLAGLLVLLVGLRTGTHRGVSVGAAGLLVAVLYAGLAGAAPAALLVGVGAVVVAWDLGGFAVDLGAQLGREADTRRVQVLHAAAAVAVALASAVAGDAVYLASTAGQPRLALLLLLVAGVVLAATLEYA